MYRPTVAEKRYAETLAALSSLSDEAAALCSTLDGAVKQRLRTQFDRAWSDGFDYGRECERRSTDSRLGRSISQAEALVARVQDALHWLYADRPPPPPRPDLKLV